MANTEVKDTLQQVEKWSQAYKLLEEFACKKCKGSCERCGFIGYCNKAILLMDK